MPTCWRCGCSSPRWYWALSWWLCNCRRPAYHCGSAGSHGKPSAWRLCCGLLRRWPPGALPCRWPGLSCRGGTRCGAGVFAGLAGARIFCGGQVSLVCAGGDGVREWAVMLGVQMQKGVVTPGHGGHRGQPAGGGCVQNNRAVVLFRGSAANGLRAVRSYLTEHGAPNLPQCLPWICATAAQKSPLTGRGAVTIAQMPQGLTHLQLLYTAGS